MNHQRVVSMQHRCNRCQRMFGSPSTLAKHLIKPSQCHRPYHVCDKCKISYASSQSLSNHKRRCTGPESNFCDKYKRAFSTHQALTGHKRWKCNLIDQKRPAVAAAGIKLQQPKGKVPATVNPKPNKKTDKADSVNSILDSIIKPQLSTKDKDNDVDSILDNIIKPKLSSKDKDNDINEENKIITIIQKLDNAYRTGFKKLLKALKSSNVEDNELILPKILDKLKTLPVEDRIELEYFVNKLDRLRVEELIKAVFACVMRRHQQCV